MPHFNCFGCGRVFKLRRALTGHYLGSQICRQSFENARVATILGPSESSPPPQERAQSSSPMDSSPIGMSPPLPGDASEVPCESPPGSQGSVSIEDVTHEDSGFPESTIVEEFPHAGESKGFEKSVRKKEWEDLAQNRSTPYEPFQSLDEWEFSEWLIQSNVSQSAMDKLLKLRWVCKSALPVSLLLIRKDVIYRLRAISSHFHLIARIIS